MYESTTPSFDADDHSTNPSGNRPFADVAAARLSRRALIGGGLATGAAAFLGAGLASSPAGAAGRGNGRGRGHGRGQNRGHWKSQSLGFEPIPLAFGEEIVVPDGYRADVLIPWGDPIAPGGPAFRPDASNSAADQAMQLGMGHDAIAFFSLDRSNHRSTRGLLVLNHEYTRDDLLFPDGVENWDAEKTAKSQHAHGVAVVEVARRHRGWRVVNSRYARRITAATPMAMSGPVAGHSLVRTVDDPEGRTPVGTWNNCANGVTPWGTYLACEENFHGYFGATGDFAPDELQERYGLSGSSGYRWYTTEARFDLSNPASVNEPNRCGWVVEIDPMDPSSTPTKRSALGRVKHEGAFVTEGRGGRAVVYMGDDQRFDYLYKFVSARNWRSMRARGQSPLDEGTLYVARFHEDGTGEWLPLVHGHGPLTAANGFADQGDVLVKTRLAADALGATPMDRCEWTTVAPNGDCFVTCTNNSQRTEPNVANPRTPNSWGHIIRWRDSGRHTGTTFEWDLFLLAGPGGGIDGSTVDADDGFGSPDGLWADPDGRLWIQTDGSQPDGANNQMLAADPRSGELGRFLTGVAGCEVTGVDVTPDQRTMFVNIQHPGGTWPSDDGARPRDATVVVTKDDGGVIGT